jgi:vitamin B12 transporter
MGPIGNESLKPERSTGWDIGIEQYFLEGQILLSAAYFKNDYTNLIQFDFLQGYTNVGNAESKGIELFIQVHSRSGLILNVSYTRTEAKDLDADSPLLRRPKDKFSASILYPFLKKGNIHLSLIHCGEREDQDFSTWPAARVTLPDYTLLNSVISYDLTQQIQIFLRMDNILNEKYELIKGYGTPVRSAFLGLNISL